MVDKNVVISNDDISNYACRICPCLNLVSVCVLIFELIVNRMNAGKEFDFCVQ